jgi:uncharacterized cupredoxin-like copper-binding protein
MERRAAAIASLCICFLLPGGLFASDAGVGVGRVGDLVRIEQLIFYPDTLHFPGDAFAVLIVQNREEAPIQHEILSKDLFRPETLVSVQGTGEIQYDKRRVSRVLLWPGEEVVIWFYAAKGRSYEFQCDLNGHAMKGSIHAF